MFWQYHHSWTHCQLHVWRYLKSMVAVDTSDVPCSNLLVLPSVVLLLATSALVLLHRCCSISASRCLRLRSSSSNPSLLVIGVQHMICCCRVATDTGISIPGRCDSFVLHPYVTSAPFNENVKAFMTAFIRHCVLLRV